MKLIQAIQLGDNQITDITVKKANVSHLRGLSLSKLFALETDELAKFLPRVTEPSIPTPKIYDMHIMDFTNLTTEAISFLAQDTTPTE